jgi:hypothetical protein
MQTKIFVSIMNNSLNETDHAYWSICPAAY